ncbi:MAG: hypothetical protein LDL41_04195 [Coleofasciculus sp. S288]|nr:hypothetical protein [Coleofasciculus sp. S288]
MIITIKAREKSLTSQISEFAKFEATAAPNVASVRKSWAVFRPEDVDSPAYQDFISY